MKYVMALSLIFFLTACGNTNNRQVLPPELQGGPLTNNLPPVSTDPVSNLPFASTTDSESATADDQAMTGAETEVAEPTRTPLEASNCIAITNDLETSFADMNFCETNSDCLVAEGSCPFGCYLFHNSSIDFADYQPALTAYQENCNPCTYRCSEAPRAADRRCVEGRCVDIRFLES